MAALLSVASFAFQVAVQGQISAQLAFGLVFCRLWQFMAGTCAYLSVAGVTAVNKMENEGQPYGGLSVVTAVDASSSSFSSDDDSNDGGNNENELLLHNIKSETWRQQWNSSKHFFLTCCCVPSGQWCEKPHAATAVAETLAFLCLITALFWPNILNIWGLSFFVFGEGVEATTAKAVLVVACTVALIVVDGRRLAGRSCQGGGTSSLGHRLLTIRWATMLGDVSYTLYLVHWPAIVFVHYLFPTSHHLVCFRIVCLHSSHTVLLFFLLDR
jgi:peptidoglycan/LPS O-acetylase OafA/YrhL